MLKRNARERQTQNVSAVENLFPGTVILPLANVTLDLDELMEVHRGSHNSACNILKELSF